MQITKTILTICIACLGIVVSIASAEPAVVMKIDDLTGSAIDGDGNLALVVCDSMMVETNSENDVINYFCRGKGLSNSSGQAVKYDVYNNPYYWLSGIEVPCGFLRADGTLVLTYDWTESVSASGNFVFRCKFKID
jgi:hypothetical protein